MKLKKYIYALALPVVLLCSCDSDLDEITYNPEQNVAAVLESIDASYVLKMDDAEETAITFKWAKPEVNYDAAITTLLQMDVKGKNFAGGGMQLIASTMLDDSYAVKTSDLNGLILKMLEAYEMDIEPVEVEFRLSSSIATNVSEFVSNIIGAIITPYDSEVEYPFIALRGDYNGWDFAKSQKVYSVESNNKYAGMVYLADKGANGWKFCEDEGWAVSWGLEDSATAEQTSITLTTNNGGNIDIYTHSSYYFEFDNSTGELKVSKTHDSWGIVGGHNGWGSGDTVMTLDNEVDKSGKTQYFLTATLDMDAGNPWKIRPDETWSDDIGPGAVEGEFEVNGDNFGVSAAGNYTIKWYFNKVKQQVIVIKN